VRRGAATDNVRGETQIASSGIGGEQGVGMKRLQAEPQSALSTAGTLCILDTMTAHSDRLKRAIARQARIQRARDIAWMLCAAFGSTALFAAIVAGLYLVTPAAPQLAAWIYAAVAVLAAFLAFRFFVAARAIHRRMEDAEHLSATADEGRETAVSIWAEAFPRRRG
jgi:hypothetical protein